MARGDESGLRLLGTCRMAGFVTSLLCVVKVVAEPIHPACKTGRRWKAQLINVGECREQECKNVLGASCTHALDRST